MHRYQFAPVIAHTVDRAQIHVTASFEYILSSDLVCDGWMYSCIHETDSNTTLRTVCARSSKIGFSRLGVEHCERGRNIYRIFAPVIVVVLAWSSHEEDERNPFQLS